MAAKVALAMLVSLGLSIVATATAHCAAAARGHVVWSAASWLVGLALVMASVRRGQAQLAE